MIFERWIPVDLMRIPGHAVDIGLPVWTGDNLSVRVGAEVTANGVPAEISGTVTGHVILPSGAAIDTITGSSSGSRAWIDLPERAFVLPGRIQIALRVTDGSAKTVILAAYATVRNPSSAVEYDPDDEVPTWAQVNEKLDQLDTALSENTHPVSYDTENPQELTPAEQAQARQNISAADAGLVDALHGLVDYGYGTPGTGSVGNASFTRSGILLAITGSNETSTTPVRARLNGGFNVIGTSSVPSGWGTGLALTAGHTYRWTVRQVRGTATKPPLARVYAEGSFTDIGGTAADSERNSVYTFVYASTPVNLCMVYSRSSGGATFTDCVYECTLTDENSERDLPPVPTTAGTYTLKVTVANGIPSYAWVSDGGLLSTPLTLTGGETE